MPKVFLSVGRTFTPEQEAFVASVESRLTEAGFTPQTLGRSYFSSEAPLKAISGLMDECHGTVIIAFERIQIERGLEKRRSDQQTEVQNVLLPTVWNQIEATMAYERGHPLLVIVEQGMREEGLLEPGYDWYVQRVPLAETALHDREFSGIFDDWASRVSSDGANLPDDQPEAPVPPVPAPRSTEPIKILFLAANPTDSEPLRLDEESRAIDESLRKADYRDSFSLDQARALRVSDLQDALLRFKPHIVHFSGHGSSSGELVLEDADGTGRPVPSRALESLFRVLKDNIRCVVLNACYSHTQATAIAKNIDFVVGMSADIGDKAARAFAAAFYQGLAYGRSVQTAFDLGLVEIDLNASPDVSVPVLIAERAEPESTVFAEAIR